MTFGQIKLPHAIGEVMKHVDHMRTDTPYRKSGSGQDRQAGRYVVDTLNSYGLDAYLQEFETFDSDLGESHLEIVSPERRVLKSLPCCHIDATPEGGYTSELVDVGAGSFADYEGKNVKGKIVLAEVSYAPSTPEKARIASVMGAAGILLMNWGRENEPDIPWRGLKSVWGNPTPETWNDIPRLFGVSISRADGVAIRELMRHGKVEVTAKVTSKREWRVLPQPIGWLRAPETAPERDQFVIVSGHIDSWFPGVTDNITGDAVMMEIARVLSADRAKLKRSVVFCFWNGHEVAEAAGSTYFVDSHWEQINKSAVAYLNIDSVGMKGTNEFHISACPELMDFSRQVAEAALGDSLPIVTANLDRFGDQSFFGVGVNSSTARHGFSKDIVKKLHGATIGWYNHTEHDTIEIVDVGILERDTDYWVRLVNDLATVDVLPQRFTPRAKDLVARFGEMIGNGDDPAELSRIPAALEGLSGDLVWLDSLLDSLADKPANDPLLLRANSTVLRVARQLTFLTGSASGKYGQDSYGVSTLAEPVPLLAPLNEYRAVDSGSLEAKLLTTKLIRLRQTVTDAIESTRAILADLKAVA
jgi:hypothetical protein